MYKDCQAAVECEDIAVSLYSSPMAVGRPWRLALGCCSLFSWLARGAAQWYRPAVGRLRKALREVEMKGWWVLVLCSLFEVRSNRTRKKVSETLSRKPDARMRARNVSKPNCTNAHWPPSFVMLYIRDYTYNDIRVSLQCDNILSRRRNSTHFASRWIDLMLDARINDPGLSTCKQMRYQLMCSRGFLARFRSSRNRRRFGTALAFMFMSKPCVAPISSYILGNTLADHLHSFRPQVHVIPDLD